MKKVPKNIGVLIDAFAFSRTFNRQAARMRLEDAIVEAVNAAYIRSSQIASGMTMDPESLKLHPDIPFKDFNESARISAHQCAQVIAMDIAEEKDKE
jgi:hypothetical protein